MFEEQYLQGKKMKWYKFQKYFLLPFMCIAFGARALGGIMELIVFRGNPRYWVAVIDAIFALTSITLIAISTRGMYVREWKGPACFMAFLVVSLLNTLYDPVILGAYVGEYTQTDASIIGLICFLAYFVFFLLNFIYYDRRRYFFESWYAYHEEELQAEAAGGAEEPAEQAADRLPEEPTEAISEEPASPAQALSPISEVPEKKKVRVHIHKASAQNVEAGSKIIPDEECRKPQKKGNVVLVVFSTLSCALLIATGVSVFFAVRSARNASAAEEMYALLQADYESLEDDLESEEAAVRSKNAQIRFLTADLETAEEDYDDLFESFAELVEENSFYYSHIGFVVSGEYVYHRYYCPRFQTSDGFYAHNIEYCEYLGYSQCPDCW